jgi:hypothetical protein
VVGPDRESTGTSGTAQVAGFIRVSPRVFYALGSSKREKTYS